ncbi:hypothetical protein RR42_m3190 [Cupriavidus basilensis]|uniref:Uncharacterized protein n=1 Tax=Cupriavidus basilensis TaxID=68895 RepID=A0A0C4YCC8_9BURK|nr:hypothetical protein RR42_m3190 [Cupriavidus basilensis]
MRQARPKSPGQACSQPGMPQPWPDCGMEATTWATRLGKCLGAGLKYQV